MNLYAYAANNPLVLNDPKGQCPFCLAPAGVALPQAGGAIVAAGAIGVGVPAVIANTNTIWTPSQRAEANAGLRGTATIVGGVAALPAAVGIGVAGVGVAGAAAIRNPIQAQRVAESFINGFTGDPYPVGQLPEWLAYFAGEAARGSVDRRGFDGAFTTDSGVRREAPPEPTGGITSMTAGTDAYCIKGC